MPRKPMNNRFGKQNKHFFNHDDRTARMDDDHPMDFGAAKVRVVSFKKARLVPDRSRYIRPMIKEYLGDDAMSSGANNNPRQVMFRTKNRMKGGRLSPMAQRGPKLHKNRTNFSGEAQWYKITILYGDQYEKDFILNSLLSYIAPDTFIPIMYKVIGQEAIFYVDSQETANKLSECNKKITTPDNHKIQVRIRPGFPRCEIDDTLRGKLKAAMAKRYRQENNALDLSCFHHDPDLVQDYFCALFRPVMLMLVLDIVAEAIPNLEALNLDNNKLSMVDKLVFLEKKFKHLKILYIGDNKIREMHQLDVLKDLQLEELRLAGNPVVLQRYKKRTDDYISDVRKKFPKLLRLDGMELPKPILFDVAEEGIQVPPTQKVFAKNGEALKVAEQFMLQYFTIFDSDSRQPLLDAYHEHAFFSLTVAPCPTIQKFNKYTPDNRNLFRSSDTSRRTKLLKQGRLPVVSFISELPKTQHYLNSFTMDIGAVTPSTIMITVTGLFKEVGTKDQAIRYFDRSFIIVKYGSGYCIKNEQLHLAHPTPTQERQVINSPQNSIAEQAAAAQASVQQVPQQQQQQQPQQQLQAQPQPSTSGTSEPNQQLQHQMTVALMEQTKMNLEWSFKCLQEVQWNFDTAIRAFNEFFQAGRIPPEAFS
ncbi:nuclear RNA export factor 1-like [Microplitis mediator]|uniref:nuclear RNA export factor 1-like n=1 Tax=Microplitis mediator TaxID=375433 RepID=UPI0025523EB6|nr:nuclear RNA export factor 1-like [Microplitis mediator]XP_057318715.1 nuclear RNA export factor 1-like [Microplitis mediator]